jgi:hypothetical protein
MHYWRNSGQWEACLKMFMNVNQSKFKQTNAESAQIHLNPSQADFIWLIDFYFSYSIKSEQKTKSLTCPQAVIRRSSDGIQHIDYA